MLGVRAHAPLSARAERWARTVATNYVLRPSARPATAGRKAVRFTVAAVALAVLAGFVATFPALFGGKQPGEAATPAFLASALGPPQPDAPATRSPFSPSPRWPSWRCFMPMLIWGTCFGRS